VVLDKVRDNYHKDFVVDEGQHWLLHREGTCALRPVDMGFGRLISAQPFVLFFPSRKLLLMVTGIQS
jgi:hypothetical protein